MSYGIELANPSPENDALAVKVLVNFVDPTNRVVNTETVDVDRIGAGTIFYLGGYTTIPDSSPVSKLEIVARIGSQAPKRRSGRSLRRPRPGPAMGSGLDRRGRRPDRERPPDDAAEAQQISAVIFDSAGNVIGGSRGGNYGELAPGVRAYFQASQGADAIPFDRAAGANVSTIGAYEATS